MATLPPKSGRFTNPTPESCGRRAASLIELLVVLFIIGIMMSLLFPALQNARNKAQETVCENNVRQLYLALSRFDNVKRKFPAPQQWTIDVLPWLEQRPLAREFEHFFDPKAYYPRPPLMRCPMQEDFQSSVNKMNFCHYVLVVDRFPNGAIERGFEIQDRPVLSEANPEQPWYVGPEMTYLDQARVFANERGPHSGGLYMTRRGLYPQ